MVAFTTPPCRAAVRLNSGVRHLLKQIRSFFQNQDKTSFLTQVVWNFLFALASSFSLAAIAYLIANAIGATWFTSGTSSAEQLDTLTVLGVIALAPLLETLLLILGLKFCELLGLGFFRAAAVSAIGWAILHGFLMPIRFFGSVISFFVFGCAYLAWRRQSFSKGFWAAALPHGLVNATVVLVAAAGSNV